MSEAIRILGFDPGTRVAGYGVLDAAAGGRPRLVACGAIELGGGSMAARLWSLHERLEEVIRLHRPSVFAVETVFHGKSFASVLKVGEARGVGLVAAAAHGLAVEEFPPAVVKKTATGNGRASKAQVQSMVVRLLDLERAPGPPDVTDALAIAFCYAQRLWRRRLPVRRPTRASLRLKELERRARSALPNPARTAIRTDGKET